MEIAYATLHLKPSPAQQAALEKLLVDQQDPASPDYHHWLTPEEYGDRFGLSRGDVGRIVAWLESEGLKVNGVARGRRWITFSGSAAGVARGFRTEFHRYLTDGKTHFANATEPSIPEALADVVAGVEGLDDYYPAAANTTSTGGHHLAPDDIATIYNLKPLYAAGFSGSGQSIAVLGDTNIDLTDIRTFRTRFNLPANDPKIVLVGPDPGFIDSPGEAYLDVEWAGAAAPKATIIFIYAKGVGTALKYAVDQRIAPVITESFGGCETAMSPPQRAIAQQANAEGITWMASTGDVGAAGCERQGKLAQASKGLAVQTPASIPEVTAVGGTEFDESGGTYWSTTNNSNLGSAISYIPEKVWNDSLANGSLDASTGGASVLYSKPWWQTGAGVPNDNARDVPDVSLTASSGHDGYITYMNGTAHYSGGTSAGTPVFAGFIAVLNQYLVSKSVLSQPGLGNINPTLYRLAQTVPAAFHDIVNGDNVVPCMQGTSDCSNGSFGFAAGPGYDLATGLGSIDAYLLATNWASGTATSTTVTASPQSVASNAGDVRLTATVKAQAGAPAGDVTFLLNGNSIGTATLSPSGGSSSATLAVNALLLPVGADAVTAVYGGSGAFNASAGTATVTVTAPSGASAVTASISPDPVYQHAPDVNGMTWTYTMRLTNQSAVSTTLTKLTIDGVDDSAQIASWFGTATIPANGSVSATRAIRGLNPPVDRVFVFAGKDAGGTTWSQQVTARFMARVAVEPSLLVTTPATVPPDPAADSSCRWPQPLVIEEQGGYDVQLTTLKSGNTDLSGQLQQIFGTTAIAPFGRLQGTLCWDSGTSPGAKSINLAGGLTEFDGNRVVSTSASTTLSGSASGGFRVSASPAVVSMPADSSQRATVSLSFNGGAPQWTAKISPSNRLTSWLSVSPLSGTGPAQLNLTASGAGLANGVYNAAILIQSSASPQFVSVPVALIVGRSSNVSIAGVTNGASYKTAFAPGMLMSVFGTNLAPAAQHAGSVPLPLNMQGVSATVNGFSAPLLDVTPGQLNIQVPYEVGAGTAILGVNNNGQAAYFPFQVQASAPGIFMTLDGAGNLVPYAAGKRGQTLLAFITGEGDVQPALMTGKTPTTTDVTQLPAPALPLGLTVGGVPATIAFAGMPRGLVGVTQINFTIPDGAPLGPQQVVVTVGGVASAPVTLTVTP